MKPTIIIELLNVKTDLAGAVAHHPRVLHHIVVKINQVRS